MKTLVKEDDSITTSEKIKALRERGMKDSDISQWIGDQYDNGKLTKEEAAKLYMEANPKKTKNDAYFYFEQKDWENETGKDVGSSDYFRLNDAIDSNNQTEYTKAVKELTAHGYDAEKINSHVKDRIIDNYRDGKATRKQTESALKKYAKDLSDDDIWWSIDRVDWAKSHKLTESVTGQYYRLYDAIEKNRSDDIKAAVQTMTKHGMKAENIKKQLGTKYKQAYLDAKGAEKTKLKDALTKAYKAIGLTATDALKIINGWKPASNKK